MSHDSQLFKVWLVLLPVQLGLHLWPDWSLLWGLRIDYWAPTIYLTDILLLFIFLLGFFTEIKTRRLPPRSFWFWLFVVVLVLAISNSRAVNPPVAWLKTATLVKLAILVFYIRKRRYNLSFISPYLFLGTVAACLIGLGQFVKQASLDGLFWYLGERTFSSASFGIALLSFQGQLWLRPYSLFPHPNALAGYILASVCLVQPGNWPWRQRILFPAYCLVGLMVILSYSQAAWLAVFFLVLIRVKQWRYQTALMGALVTGIYFWVRYIDTLFLSQFILSMQLNRVAFFVWRLSPFWGTGLNNYLAQLVNYLPHLSNQSFWQPVHNLWLLIASETGLIGLTAAAVLFFKTFKKASSGLRAALVVVFVTSWFDHYWFTLQQTQLLLALIIGLIWVDPSLFKKPLIR